MTDATTSGGKLKFFIFGTLAEFERNLIRERTQVGLTRPSSQPHRWLASEDDVAETRSGTTNAGKGHLADIAEIIGLGRTRHPLSTPETVSRPTDA